MKHSLLFSSFTSFYTIYLYYIKYIDKSFLFLNIKLSYYFFSFSLSLFFKQIIILFDKYMMVLLHQSLSFFLVISKSYSIPRNYINISSFLWRKNSTFMRYLSSQWTFSPLTSHCILKLCSFFSHLKILQVFDVSWGIYIYKL